jgi:hypothetical protein
MSDFDKSTFTDFGKLVPGFDFLQNLTRQATASAGQGQPKLPQLGHWVAPTMSVEELEKRITELKAVQFWLDQNATALKATIQALEVQKMTLATLHGMNVNMTEMAKAFSVKMPESAASPTANKAAVPDEPSQGRQFFGFEVPETTAPPRAPDSEPEQAPAAAAPPASAPGGVDPMQWWGALTQQFQSIAASALKEVADRHTQDAGKGMAEEAIKTATEFAESASQSFSKAANEAREFAAGTTQTQRKPTVTPAAKTPAKPATKPTAKTTAKTTTETPVNAPVKAKAKAKPKAKVPTRPLVAAVRKSPTRAR